VRKKEYMTSMHSYVALAASFKKKKTLIKKIISKLNQRKKKSTIVGIRDSIFRIIQVESSRLVQVNDTPPEDNILQILHVLM